MNKTLSAVGENSFNGAENYSNAGENKSGERKNYSAVNTKNSRPVFYGWEGEVKRPTLEKPVNCFQIRDSRVELLIFSVFREYMCFKITEIK